MIKFYIIGGSSMNIKKSVHPTSRIPYRFSCEEDTKAAELAVNQRFFYGDDLQEELEKATYARSSDLPKLLSSDVSANHEDKAVPRPVAVAYSRILSVPEFLSNTMKLTLDSFVKSQKGYVNN